MPLRNTVHLDESHDFFVFQCAVIIDDRMIAADDLFLFKFFYFLFYLLFIFLEYVGKVLRREPRVVFKKIKQCI